MTLEAQIKDAVEKLPDDYEINISITSKGHFVSMTDPYHDKQLIDRPSDDLTQSVARCVGKALGII